jgi:Leucine-rich repeat (LRR) protein
MLRWCHCLIDGPFVCPVPHLLSSGHRQPDVLQNLVHLDISNNQIRGLKPLAGLKRLQVLLVTDNNITSLGGIGQCGALNRLDASQNQITELQHVSDASQCPLLGTILLTGNPAQLVMDYRLHIVSLLPQVSSLDSVLVDEKEKVRCKGPDCLLLAPSLVLAQ